MQDWEGGHYLAVQWRTELSKGNLTECYQEVSRAINGVRHEDRTVHRELAGLIYDCVLCSISGISQLKSVLEMYRVKLGYGRHQVLVNTDLYGRTSGTYSVSVSVQRTFSQNVHTFSIVIR